MLQPQANWKSFRSVHKNLTAYRWKCCECNSFYVIVLRLEKYVGRQRCRRLYSSFISKTTTPARAHTMSVLRRLTISVKLHLSDKWTNGHVRLSDCPLCLSGVSILWGTRCNASQKFTEGKGLKIWDQPIDITKIGQSIIRKIIKIIATRCHILRLKCSKFVS